MRLLGIEDLAGKPIGTLSGGQQQKALIAQNIAKEPEVMLLDEPFSNLDFQAREFITSILKEMVKSGVPIIMVSHAFDDLPDMGIRILVMNSGRITFDTTCRPGDVEAIVRRCSAVA
jgi:zinc/manganese transport system ATP-binding protein